MRRSEINPDELNPRQVYARSEGGAVYTAEKSGCFYAIVDESSMASILSEEDLEGLELVKVIEFDTEEERSNYLARKYRRTPGTGSDLD